MGKLQTTLCRVLQLLEKHYGRPKPPQVTDPLEMILLENVAYLVDDEKRAAAFSALKSRVGTRPEKIMAVPDQALVEIARMGGILPEHRANKLRRIAEIAHYIFKGDLGVVLKKPFREAKDDLKKFPSIGDPGAEKILLFTRSQPVLALDSNSLRVLQRLGFGEEKKNYAAAYRSAQEATADQLPRDCDTLIRAYQLLRQHGRELCKRSRPLCDTCPLQSECQYFQTTLQRKPAANSDC